MILDVYNHFNARPGHTLRANNFIAVMVNNRWHADNLKDGIRLCMERNYLEEGPNDSLKITEACFAAM